MDQTTTGNKRPTVATGHAILITYIFSHIVWNERIHAGRLNDNIWTLSFTCGFHREIIYVPVVFLAVGKLLVPSGHINL